jgi:hypothetical protein
MPTTLKRDSLLSFANSHRDEFENLLQRFVETPTVSVDPNHLDDIKKGVELTVETIEGYGGKAEVYRAEKGNPVIHGVFGNARIFRPLRFTTTSTSSLLRRKPNRGTPSPLSSQRRATLTYGRGSLTTRAQRSARSSAPARRLRLTFRSTSAFCGSLRKRSARRISKRSLPKRAKPAHRFRRRFDTVWVHANRPASSAGLRGLLGFILTLETATVDTHSAKRRRVAQSDRRVDAASHAIIYDPRTARSKSKAFTTTSFRRRKRAAGLGKLRLHDEGVQESAPLKKMRTEDPLEVMKRIWGMPTLEVHGIVGGYQGPGVKSIVPPRAS